jgi:hypothetical protein
MAEFVGHACFGGASIDEFHRRDSPSPEIVGCAQGFAESDLQGFADPAGQSAATPSIRGTKRTGRSSS